MNLQNYRRGEIYEKRDHGIYDIFLHDKGILVIQLLCSSNKNYNKGAYHEIDRSNHQT